MFWEEKRDNIKNFEIKNKLEDAFAKVKVDILSLGNEVYSIKNELTELKNHMSALMESINSLKIELFDIKNSFKTPTDIPTHSPKNPTYSALPSDIPTVPQEIRGLKYPNLDTSTGNRGVPTDRQTDQQTDKKEAFFVNKAYFDSFQKSQPQPLKKQIQEAEDILNSLDNLKKEIRLQFKQITNQEMLIFSTVYQLEDQFPEGIEYRQIAVKLGLSESSIRDYVQKLISKGIPLDKIKLNNKKILLKIAPKLKNIAPLETLIKLREL